jgi:hypothetical protein
MEVYAADVERKMKRFFGWLSEQDRRCYAAGEAAQRGHGGVEYIARSVAGDPQTMRPGLRDLAEEEEAAAGRIRTQGADARREPSRRHSWKRTSAPCGRSAPPVLPCVPGSCGPTCRCARSRDGGGRWARRRVVVRSGG